MSNFKDLTGQRFEDVEVLAYQKSEKRRSFYVRLMMAELTGIVRLWDE